MYLQSDAIDEQCTVDLFFVMNLSLNRFDSRFIKLCTTLYNVHYRDSGRVQKKLKIVRKSAEIFQKVVEYELA